MAGQLRTNQLWFGDNLEILRDHVRDESVDLVYLDPPFNSNRAFNIIFEKHPGDIETAAAQKRPSKIRGTGRRLPSGYFSST